MQHEGRGRIHPQAAGGLLAARGHRRLAFVSANPRLLISRHRLEGLRQGIVEAGGRIELEIIERLIRSGIYMGPMNIASCGYGGGSMGRNPFDWMEMLRRTPHGSSSVTFWSSMRGNIAMTQRSDNRVEIRWVTVN